MNTDEEIFQKVVQMDNNNAQWGDIFQATGKDNAYLQNLLAKPEFASRFRQTGPNSPSAHAITPLALGQTSLPTVTNMAAPAPAEIPVTGASTIGQPLAPLDPSIAHNSGVSPTAGTYNPNPTGGYDSRGNPLNSAPIDQMKPTVNQADLAFRPGESVAQYQARTKELYNNPASKSAGMANGLLDSVGNPIVGANVKSGATYTPPTGNNGVGVNDYNLGVLNTVDKYRSQLDTTLKNLEASSKAQKDAEQLKIDQINADQKGAIEGNKTATQKLTSDAMVEIDRQSAIKREQQNKYVDLVDELDSLLTQGNASIDAAKNVSGLAALRDPIIAQQQMAVAARAGVIQAVLAGRNGAVVQAQNYISQAMDVLNIKKTDQLNYFNSLNQFYDNNKSTENAKLVQLTADQKNYIQQQITQTQNDLVDARASETAIKNLMTNPETALLAAQAGITLNDSVQTINAKMKNVLITQDKAAISNKMAENGYSSVTDTTGLDPNRLVTATNPDGTTSTFYKKAAADIKEVQGGLFDVTNNKWIVPAKPSTGTTTDDKTIASFQKDAADYVLKLDTGAISWDAAWQALHVQYPAMSVQAIDGVLNVAKYRPGYGTSQSTPQTTPETNTPPAKSEPVVTGKGAFTSVGLTDRLKQLQDANVKMGVPKNTSLRESLVAAGYPVSEVDKVMHPLQTGVRQTINNIATGLGNLFK